MSQGAGVVHFACQHRFRGKAGHDKLHLVGGNSVPARDKVEKVFFTFMYPNRLADKVLG